MTGKPPSNIVEKHGLTQLLQHVLSEDYKLQTYRFQDDVRPPRHHFSPLRSGFDLAPHGRSDLYLEGRGKVWKKVDEETIERLVKDIAGNGYDSNVGGELLDTRMLGTQMASKVDITLQKGTATGGTAGGTAGGGTGAAAPGVKKIKLKLKK
jgi:hypothetical protein